MQQLNWLKWISMQWNEMQSNVMNCLQVCLWASLSYGDGASRVRKGTPGSLPSGLFTPTVPWVQSYWAFTGYKWDNLKYMGWNHWDYETLRYKLFELFSKG